MDVAPAATSTSTLEDDNLRRITEIFMRLGLNPQRLPHEYAACLPASPKTPRKNNANEESPRLGRRAKHMTQRPQCTHVVVVRVHGNNSCHICSRPPSNGWLYVCQQDHQLTSSDSFPDTDAMPGVLDTSNYFDAQSHVAEQLGMSASVIHGIQSRYYDVNEVEKLLNQRLEVIRTIKKAEKVSSGDLPMSDNYTPGNEENFITSVGGGASHNLGTIGGSTSSPESERSSCDALTGGNQQKQHSDRPRTKDKLTCEFQVCHACRPTFADRLYTSFEPILNGEVPYLTEEELDQMPLIDNSVLSTIGLRKTHEPDRQLRFEEDNDIVDQVITDTKEEISIDWTPTSSSESEEIDEHTDGKDGHPDSRNDSGQIVECALHPPRTNDSGNRYETPTYSLTFSRTNSAISKSPEVMSSSIDVDLLSTPGGNSTASSISLPTPSTAPMVPLTPSDDAFEMALMKRTGNYQKARSICCDLGNRRLRRQRSFSRQDSSSSFGSEMEVEGGVALTEEAIGMGIPDILTEDGLTMREV